MRLSVQPQQAVCIITLPCAPSFQSSPCLPHYSFFLPALGNKWLRFSAALQTRSSAGATAGQEPLLDSLDSCSGQPTSGIFSFIFRAFSSFQATQWERKSLELQLEWNLIAQTAVVQPERTDRYKCCQLSSKSSTRSMRCFCCLLCHRVGNFTLLNWAQPGSVKVLLAAQRQRNLPATEDGTGSSRWHFQSRITINKLLGQEFAFP